MDGGTPFNLSFRMRYKLTHMRYAVIWYDMREKQMYPGGGGPGGGRGPGTFGARIFDPKCMPTSKIFPIFLQQLSSKMFYHSENVVFTRQDNQWMLACHITYPPNYLEQIHEVLRHEKGDLQTKNKHVSTMFLNTLLRHVQGMKRSRSYCLVWEAIVVLISVHTIFFVSV